MEHDSVNGTFHANGYYSLSIVYTVFAAANWVSPSIVSAIGPRMSMFFSAIVYTGFIAVFLKLKAWSLYMMSAFIGFAAAGEFGKCPILRASMCQPKRIFLNYVSRLIIDYSIYI